MKNKTNILIAIILIISITVSASGCAYRAQAASNLMADVTANVKDSLSPDTKFSTALCDFGTELFKKSVVIGENTLISPLSVYYALSMSANGADGNTLTELENTLGLKVSELNSYMLGYKKTVGEQMKLSNSVWFDTDLNIKQSFLQTNADYYSTDAYQTPFDDTVISQMNEWIEKSTDGMIKEMLSELAPNARAYILNALTFDAKWKNKYYKTDIVTQDFKNADGSKTETEFLNSNESIYIKDESVNGFIKHYEGEKYAFCALLPDESINLNEYISSLDGEKIQEILTSAQRKELEVSMPKFEIEFDCELIGALSKMGITDAFTFDADFSGLSEHELYISEILHKTYISVDENGTKAAAATSIANSDKSAPVDFYRIQLDRPFVYMIIDCEYNLPIFIGNVNSL